MDRIIGGKYGQERMIGSGFFGEINLGEWIGALFLLLSINSSRGSFFFVLVGSNLLVLILSVSATHVDTFEIVAVKIVSCLIFFCLISFRSVPADFRGRFRFFVLFFTIFSNEWWRFGFYRAIGGVWLIFILIVVFLTSRGRQLTCDAVLYGPARMV